jgi:hypothetical protein
MEAESRTGLRSPAPACLCGGDICGCVSAVCQCSCWPFVFVCVPVFCCMCRLSPTRARALSRWTKVVLTYPHLVGANQKLSSPFLSRAFIIDVTCEDGSHYKLTKLRFSQAPPLPSVVCLLVTLFVCLCLFVVSVFLYVFLCGGICIT